jgi:hypothetical protein
MGVSFVSLCAGLGRSGCRIAGFRRLRAQISLAVLGDHTRSPRHGASPERIDRVLRGSGDVPARPDPTGGYGAPVEDDDLAAALANVEVRRSRRRTRTVTAFRESGRTVVAIPDRFSRSQEREWVERMVARMLVSERRRTPSDIDLARRAAELSARYLDGRAVPASVTWSSRQGKRWGSCTPSEGTVRISDRLRGAPRWVLDYVLLHEIVHLIHPGHGPEFWAELASYPRTERARGYLEGFAFADDAGGRTEPGVDDGDPPADDQAQC